LACAACENKLIPCINIVLESLPQTGRLFFLCAILRSFVNRASLPECPDRDVRSTDFHSWWCACAHVVSFVNRASLPECPDRDVRSTGFHSWWSAAAGEVSSGKKVEESRKICVNGSASLTTSLRNLRIFEYLRKFYEIKECQSNFPYARFWAHGG